MEALLEIVVEFLAAGTMEAAGNKRVPRTVRLLIVHFFGAALSIGYTVLSYFFFREQNWLSVGLFGILAVVFLAGWIYAFRKNGPKETEPFFTEEEE